MSYIGLEVGLHNLNVTTMEQAEGLAAAVRDAIARAVEESGAVDSSVEVEIVESAGIVREDEA